MKKLLLSLAAVACAASMSATSYLVFDIANNHTWGGDANGYNTTVTIDGKKFTLTTEKAASKTDLISPAANTYAWRVYQDSKVKIESPDVALKTVVITFDNYEDNKYVHECTFSEGWTGSLDDVIYTCTSAGLNTFELTATKQVRIKTIVVSSDSDTDNPLVPEEPGKPEGGGDTPENPDDPQLPDGVIYQNAFDENLDGWVKINDESLSDFSGWKINSSPKCAICNSYYGGENHPANAKMQMEFDLTNCTDCKLSVEQGFGWTIPTEPVDNYRLYVINGSVTDYLTFANFPPKKENSNWTDFAENEFDLSEYDGCKITIGFEYATDGSTSRAWELKNFKLMGTSTGIANITADDSATPVYYNLQGVRVANPESGLFIEVKGNSTRKIQR